MSQLFVEAIMKRLFIKLWSWFASFGPGIGEYPPTWIESFAEKLSYFFTVITYNILIIPLNIIGGVFIGLREAIKHAFLD